MEPKIKTSSKIENAILSFYKIGGFIFGMSVLTFFLSDLLTPRIQLSQYSASNISLANGLNENEFKNILLDEIQTFYDKAQSLKGNNSGIKGSNKIFDIEVSGIKSNYNSILNYVQQKIGVKNTNIYISLIEIDSSYCYRIRINNNLINKQCYKTIGLNNYSILDTLIRSQAIEIIEHYDPYVLSLYHYKNQDYEKAKKLAKYSLTYQPEARKYALGTIANCHRELAEYDEANEYYEMSIKEFPLHVATICQYTQFQYVTKNYEKAKELCYEVITRDQIMQGSAMFILMQVHCDNNNHEKLEQIKNQFISKYGMETFGRLALKADC